MEDSQAPDGALSTETTEASEYPGVVNSRRPGKLSVQVLVGEAAAETVVLDRGRSVVVGRSQTAGLVLDHPSVSGAHVTLRVTEHGVEVEDLGSRNGTWVGNVRVRHALVTPGTQLVVGECVLAIAEIEDIDVELWGADHLGELVGASTVMREVFAQIADIAKSPLTVVISGETGTGKELAARAIHRYSDRSGEFVLLDCGAHNDTLIEDAMFGHARGAFTGAVEDREGCFEAANGGTVFLDELGDLPLALQTRLLRVLDRREIIRIGETQTRSVDVRIVAATHRDLAAMVAEGTFREDLYYRLTQAGIDLPPLRDRRGDALVLARHFLAEIADERGMPLRFTARAEKAIASGRWPGNVRQLRNLVQRRGHLAKSQEVDIATPEQRDGTRTVAQLADRQYYVARESFDREYFARLLEKTGNKLQPASKLAGLDRVTFRNRVTKLGLWPPRR